MVRITRNTPASVAPIPISIATNVVTQTFQIPGPMNTIDIPGDKVFNLVIPNPQLYGIRVVKDDEEFTLNEIGRIREYECIDAIIIFDGFLIGPGGLPGYTYRPFVVQGNKLYQSGKSFLYPPIVNCGIPPPSFLPPPPIPPVPFGIYGPNGQYFNDGNFSTCRDCHDQYRRCPNHRNGDEEFFDNE